MVRVVPDRLDEVLTLSCEIRERNCLDHDQLLRVADWLEQLVLENRDLILQNEDYRRKLNLPLCSDILKRHD